LPEKVELGGAVSVRQDLVSNREFARRFAALRDSHRRAGKRLPQSRIAEELTELLGVPVSHRYINKLLNGRADPHLSVIIGIAQLYQVPITALLPDDLVDEQLAPLLIALLNTANESYGDILQALPHLDAERLDHIRTIIHAPPAEWHLPHQDRDDGENDCDPDDAATTSCE